MAGIRIVISLVGATHVALAQPRSEDRAEQLWRLFRALAPEIEALEEAARREAPHVALAGAGGAS